MAPLRILAPAPAPFQFRSFCSLLSSSHLLRFSATTRARKCTRRRSECQVVSQPASRLVGAHPRGSGLASRQAVAPISRQLAHWARRRVWPSDSGREMAPPVRELNSHQWRPIWLAGGREEEEKEKATSGLFNQGQSSGRASWRQKRKLTRSGESRELLCPFDSRPKLRV